jgi:hypothetical protein
MIRSKLVVNYKNFITTKDNIISSPRCCPSYSHYFLMHELYHCPTKLCFLLYFCITKNSKRGLIASYFVMECPCWIVANYTIILAFSLVNPLTWGTTFSQLQKASNFDSWHAYKLWDNINPLSSHQSQYFCQITKKLLLTSKQCIFLFHFITNFGLTNV